LIFLPALAESADDTETQLGWSAAILVTAALWTGSGVKFFERRSLVE
jgi:hypothetical protein